MTSGVNAAMAGMCSRPKRAGEADEEAGCAGDGHEAFNVAVWDHIG